MQPWRRARLTDLESHTQWCGLAVAEVLLDLHAQLVQSHNLLGMIGAKARRVRQEPRFPGAGFCFASRLRRRGVTCSTITLAAHRAAPIQHHVAGEVEIVREPTIAPAAGFASGFCEPCAGLLPMDAVARDTYATTYASDPRPAQALDLDKPRSAKPGIGHDNDLDAYGY